MPVVRGQAITQADMTALAALGNAKLAPATPYSFAASGWLTEYNRMRSDLFARYPSSVSYVTVPDSDVLLEDEPPSFSQSQLSTVSGPWVVKVIGDEIFGGSGSLTGPGGGTLNPPNNWNWSDVEFWHLSSLTPNLTIVSRMGENNGVGIPTYLANDTSGNPNTTVKSYIRIGGTLSGVLTSDNVVGHGGSNKISIQTFGDGGAVTPAALNVTTDIPGATVSYSADHNFAVVSLPAGVIAPGVYTLEATETAPFWHFGPGFLVQGLTFTADAADGESLEEEVPAIHSSGAVSRVASVDPDSVGWPFGIYVVDINNRFWKGPQTSWHVDCAGLFVAKTIPVDRENAELDIYLPWTINGSSSTMQDKAPAADTATVKGVEPAVSYRVGRFPCSKNSATVPSWSTYRGMCVFRVVVRRAPELVAGIYQPPALKPARNISIGYYIGATFMPLGTVTIPENAMDAAEEVFWPVFTKTPLRYSVQENPAEDAMVHCFVNYQPPYMGPSNSTNPTAHYPIAACLYNDIEAVLNKLPDAP